jgi:hypothetical protein
MKKVKNRGIFTTVILYSVAACVVSMFVAAGSGIFLYAVSTYFSEQNINQKAEFEKSRKILDTVNDQYIARFKAENVNDLKTKLAQLGFTVLLDTPHIHILYGYDEIDRISTNQASGPKNQIVSDPKGYNWPGIRLVSMMYDVSVCTTMVEFNGGENKSEQRRQIWKWERKGDKWVPLSFSKYFVASDVEISKQGISFILAPKHDTKLTKLFVLKK